MALGTMSVLGFNNGVLTQDVINKLKKADESGVITPITNKITANATKQKDLTAIKTLMSTFKSSVSNLADETMYLKRTTEANGKSATISANPGVALQDIDIDVKQLAQKDVYQSSRYIGRDSFVSGTNGKFVLKFGNIAYGIEVKSSTTIEELATQINDVTNGKVQAKVLKVGGSSPYQLIVQSKDTGKENKISFEAISGDSMSENLVKTLGWDSTNIEANHLTKAQDAEFSYNGISITRSSNEVNDLALGLNLSLKETGKTSFKIKEDPKAIKEELGKLVTAYNSLANNLKVATDYNSETKASGTFQGVTEIKSIETVINRALFSTKNITKDGRTSSLNLTAFGLSINKEGLLELKSSELDKKLENLSDIQKFFTGGITYDTVSTTGTKAVDSGEIELKDNDLTINGKKISLKTAAGNSSKENALAILKAINEAGINGLQASLTQSEDKIMLKTKDGTKIEITGNQSIMDKIGLNTMKLESKSTSNGGFFSDLKTTMDGLIGKKGTLTKYADSLTSEKKKLEEDKKKNQESLDAKYNTMEERFLAYDKILSNLNSQMTTMTNLINSELNSKK
jgi:flagellar hook-associated protein 2 C-terminal domain protein